MDTRDLRDDFSPLLDNELTPEERAAVEKQLAEDAEARLELDSVKRVDDLYRQLPPKTAPEDLAERVRASREAKSVRLQGRLRRRPMWTMLAAAAVLAVAIGLGIFYSSLQKHATTLQMAARPAAEAPAQVKTAEELALQVAAPKDLSNGVARETDRLESSTPAAEVYQAYTDAKARDKDRLESNAPGDGRLNQEIQREQIQDKAGKYDLKKVETDLAKPQAAPPPPASAAESKSVERMRMTAKPAPAGTRGESPPRKPAVQAPQRTTGYLNKDAESAKAELGYKLKEETGARELAAAPAPPPPMPAMPSPSPEPSAPAGPRQERYLTDEMDAKGLAKAPVMLPELPATSPAAEPAIASEAPGLTKGRKQQTVSGAGGTTIAQASPPKPATIAADAKPADREVDGRVFELRGGVWRQKGYQEEKAEPLRRDSPRLTELLKKHAALNAITSWREAVILNIEGTWYRLEPVTEAGGSKE